MLRLKLTRIIKRGPYKCLPFWVFKAQQICNGHQYFYAKIGRSVVFKWGLGNFTVGGLGVSKVVATFDRVGGVIFGD